jgi:transposase-like protein
MTDRKTGRPKAPVRLDWRRTISLSPQEGAWLEELARERDIPMAILLRHIVREYQERQGNGRDGNNLRAVR